MLSQGIALVRFIVGWLWTFVNSVICLTLVLLGMPRLAWVFMAPRWGRMALKILGIKLRITGAENLTGPVIFVANHESLVDAVFYPAVLPGKVKWVAKKELHRVPLWGQAFGATGAIFIDRKNPRRAVECIREGLATLPTGWSVVVFPEGTRSKDGTLGRFKKGAFHMAIQSRVPIVPIGMHGAHNIVPKGSWLIQPGDIEVTVGSPINTEQWHESEADLRVDQMRTAVAACIEASTVRYLARNPDGARKPAPDRVAGLPPEASRA